MINRMQLCELVAPLQATLRGSDAGFARVSTDSREDLSDSLFVALSGDNFDGHAFVDAALAAGASAALVARGEYAGSSLLVADTQRALGQLGQLNRAQLKGPVVGLTGSVGKTTCKEMLASIFSRRAPVLATAGNLNNEIGVPLTLLAIEQAHQAAVIEMGAAEQGDIAYLSQWVQPDIVLVTTVAPSHIGRFGSIETIARTKAEIYTHNSAEAVACINLDNEYTRAMLNAAPQQQVLTFSRLDHSADVRAENAREQQDGCWAFTLVCAQGRAEVELPVMGEHNITNALAAATAALAAELTLDDVVAGLGAFKSAARRLQQHALAGGTLIDDCYNANPESMRAAIDVLAQRQGQRILVCGDMGELGAYSADLHRSVGDYANGRIDAVWSIGDESRLIGAAFSGDARHFESQAQLLAACKETMKQEVVMLVKGSRSAQLDRVVDALVEAGGDN